MHSPRHVFFNIFIRHIFFVKTYVLAKVLIAYVVGITFLCTKISLYDMLGLFFVDRWLDICFYVILYVKY